MSRIAGWVAGQGEPASPSGALVERMLGAFTAPRATTTRVMAAARGALGAWGWRPPAIARRGPLTLVLDGAVHNRGDFPRQANDAELILALVEAEGLPRVLSRLNGELALALLDEGDGSLSLARDRFGIKPLYYVADRGRLAFASQPRALLTLPDVPRDVDPAFVARFAGCHYRVFDNDPERSPYRAIAQVPAAQVLRWRNGHLDRTTYFQLQEQGDLDLPEAALVERCRETLLDAVRLRLPGSDRRGFTLSGGMDSSSVLACAVALTGEKQPALSSTYRDATYDESSDIKTILNATVSQWHPVPADDPDLPTLVDRMVAANDEPVATATWLAHFVLCQQASELGFATLFGGLGGDELNAGEYEYFFFHFADLKAAGDQAALASEIDRWVEYHDHPVWKKSAAVVERALRELVDLETPGRCRPDRKRLTRWLGAVRREYHDLWGFEPVMDTPFRSYLKNRTYQDLYRETAPCCLRAADRQCTAFGLDVSWPFYDHRLVELMFQVPGRLKIRQGVTKHLLREAMRGIVPEETRTRIKKTGWNAPAHVWFCEAGRELVLDLLSSRAFRERGIYHPARVRELLDEHQAVVSEGRPVDNHMMFLWQLVNLELWLRRHDSLPPAAAI
jgi:asparagine synthase (glutamine-hydrolysing)